MIQLINKMRNKKGFTLIELIVVIAIIAILILIAVPAYQEFVATSQRRADYSSAATLYKAAQIYYVEEDPDVTVTAAGVASGSNTKMQWYPTDPGVAGAAPDAAIIALTDDAGDLTNADTAIVTE